ncbi:3444_t:CDS:2 [Funneliformis caledonium]|uniref:3444_t:CDS:1 n=1 Tax=Funneliformis caledonium TaxID=1117310 RepID=A0A9N9BW15_9GLOM|nr:3444_t:CDS:2 [Funneliformis caledonium]
MKDLTHATSFCVLLQKSGTSTIRIPVKVPPPGGKALKEITKKKIYPKEVMIIKWIAQIRDLFDNEASAEFKEEVRTRKQECVDKMYKKPMFGPQDTIGEPDFIVVDDNYAIRIQNPMAVLSCDRDMGQRHIFDFLWTGRDIKKSVEGH